MSTVEGRDGYVLELTQPKDASLKLFFTYCMKSAGICNEFILTDSYKFIDFFLIILRGEFCL